MTHELSQGRIRQLDDIDFADHHNVGGKAAVLGGLRQAGFPVPDGVVLTATSPPFRLSDAEMDQLVSAAQGLGAPLAVRSSGIAEDGPELSFAGQFVTLLNVEGEAALTAAVHACLNAAMAPGVHAHHSEPAQPMGILVQRMVPADAAGVAFSANPVTGDPDVLVNAVRGLGDRLVAGAVDADEWMVHDGVPVSRASSSGVIDAGEATMVAELTRRVADHLGSPQDIEWAIADGHLFLLQARPITALPMPVPADIPPGFWTRESIHAPDPLTPMMNSIWDYNAGLRRAAEEFGFLITPIGAEIAGWVYTAVEPVGAPKGAPAPPPPWLLPVLARIVPGLRRRVRQCLTAVRTDAPGRTVEHWYSQWRPEVIERISRLEGVDLSKLGDDELLDHLVATGSLIRDTAPIHYLVDFAHMFAVGELGLLMQDRLGWRDDQLFELCSGLSTSSTEPARQLARLAREALRNPTLTAAFQTPSGPTVDELTSLDPQFAVAFAAYQKQFGCRVLHDDVLQPTLGESPDFTLRLVRDQVVRGYDPDEDQRQLTSRRHAAEEAARTALSVADRAQFDRLLTRAQHAYAAREDNELFTTTIPLALVRLAALQVGRRLLALHCVDHADDVFFHPLETACAALHEGTDLRASSRLRRRERAWVETHPGPLSYGHDPGPPPSLAGFPQEVQHTARIFSWILDRALNTPRSAAPPSSLTGVAASPGRYRGPVRVILNETQFDKLRLGDVLVATNPSPVWSVLFPSIGALVTDVGGSLSHPAIIAREFRVPAVVSTQVATQQLTDGQMVTVDGTAGTIEREP